MHIFLSYTFPLFTHSHSHVHISHPSSQQALFRIPLSPPPLLPDTHCAELRHIVECCLKMNPKERLSAKQLLVRMKKREERKLRRPCFYLFFPFQ